MRDGIKKSFPRSAHASNFPAVPGVSLIVLSSVLGWSIEGNSVNEVSLASIKSNSSCSPLAKEESSQHSFKGVLGSAS